MSAPVPGTAVGLPAPALRPWITRYAGFRAYGLTPRLHFGLPSSHVHLIVSLGSPIEVVRMPSASQTPSGFPALVTGLQDAPAIIRQGQDVFGIHVFIRPLGVRALLGVAGAEISSRVVNLFDIWGKRSGDLIERLSAASCWRDRFAILDRAFALKLCPGSAPPAIDWAWRRLESTHGAAPIAELAGDIGWSRRHFSSRFRDAIGVAPKSAARVFRFQRACRLILNERPSLASVAASCGYFDQAHMTREWNALAGCSPKAWVARELPFLQDYEIEGCDNERHDSRSVHQPFV